MHIGDKQIIRLIISTIIITLCLGCAAQPVTQSTESVDTKPTLTQPMEAEAEAIETPTSVPSKGITIPKDEIEAYLDSEIQGKLRRVTYDYLDEAGTIYIKWTFKSGETNELITQTAKEDTTAILQTMYFSGIEFNKIIISGWFTQTVDINNSLEYTELLHLYYVPETLDGVKWDQVRSQYIWLIADHGEIHWILQD